MTVPLNKIFLCPLNFIQTFPYCETNGQEFILLFMVKLSQSRLLLGWSDENVVYLHVRWGSEDELDGLRHVGRLQAGERCSDSGGPTRISRVHRRLELGLHQPGRHRGHPDVGAGIPHLWRTCFMNYVRFKLEESVVWFYVDCTMLT